MALITIALISRIRTAINFTGAFRYYGRNRPSRRT